MTRTKIALYIALIFLAGGVAGAGVRSVWKTNPAPPSPVRNREDFANHLFTRMKDRLQLTPEQIIRIEPVFRKGIDEVRSIQDRSVKEVEVTVKRNHEELASLLNPDQRQKLEDWDKERDKAWRERRNRRHSGGPGGPGAPGSPAGPSSSSQPNPESSPAR